jgi:hypothetical protein
MFDNSFLRRIFEPNGDEVTGGLIKLSKEKVYNLYSSPNNVTVSNQGDKMYGERSTHEINNRCS